MNKNIKFYFDNHPTVNTFFFTTDGQAFKNEADARAHAANLEKAKKGAGEITEVTRAQADAWWKEQAPQEVIVAEAAVTEAEQAEAAALAVVNGLGKDALPSKRAAANQVLLTATTNLDNANDVLKQAMAAAALVAAPPAASVTAAAPQAENTAGADGAKAPEATNTSTETKDQLIAAAQTKLDEAIAAQNNAKNAQQALPETATPAEKRVATTMLNKTTAAVAEAQVALDEAKG